MLRADECSKQEIPSGAWPGSQREGGGIAMHCVHIIRGIECLQPGIYRQRNLRLDKIDKYKVDAEWD